MTDETPLRAGSVSPTRKGWLRDLALHLRVRGIDGGQIGDALAVVESHCDDSGEEPQEAFGEPIAYADTLEFAAPPTTHWTTAVILPVLGLAIGVNLALGAVLNWSAGVAVTVGLLASLLVFVAFAAMLIVLLRRVLTSKVALVAWFGTGFVFTVALPLVLRYELTRIPAVVALAAGLVFVAAGIVAVRRIPSDPIVDPRAHH
jgi:hypothetical protein